MSDEVDRIEPDPSLFPEFDGPLRASYKMETELFVGSVLRENQSVIICWMPTILS
jgi:hypothetical protein